MERLPGELRDSVVQPAFSKAAQRGGIPAAE